jgi:hypothetical protein
VEEARVVLQHFLAKGMGSQMAQSTAFMGKAGITSERWADMEFYVFECMEFAKNWSNQRVWNAAATINEGDFGHIHKLWVALDARWHCRGKSSIHGTQSMANQNVTGLAHFAAVHMSKNVTEEEQALLGLHKYTGTSPSMDPAGAETLVRDPSFGYPEHSTNWQRGFWQCSVLILPALLTPPNKQKTKQKTNKTKQNR